MINRILDKNKHLSSEVSSFRKHKLLTSTLASIAIMLPLQATYAQSEYGDEMTSEYHMERVISIGVGSLGFMGDFSHRIEENVAIRGVIGGLSFDYDIEQGDNTYETETSLLGAGIFVDYYPWLEGFRVSGGVLLRDVELSGTLSDDITVSINEKTYSNVTVETVVENQNLIEPVVSVGFDWFPGENIGISADLGAAYVGGYEASLTQTSGIDIPQADLDGELASINDDLGDLNIELYMKLGVAFKF